MSMKPKKFYENYNPVACFGKEVNYKYLYSDLFKCLGFWNVFWLLAKYGKFSRLHNSVTDVPEDFKGACICVSERAVRYLRKTQRGDFEYTEGLTTQAPFSLHAWVNSYTTRHECAIDYTRECDSVEANQILLLGVEFDLDFKEYVVKNQIKNRSDVLPHLRNYGHSVLTYKPLLDGVLSDYPYHDGDIERTFEVFNEFIQAFNIQLEYMKSKENRCEKN